MLDLVRLSPRRLFPPGGEELYRQIALLTEMRPGLEVLDVASGKGVPLEYFVTEFGVTASGVEIDPSMVHQADSWSRELGASDRLQFQSGRSDRLPYRDEIFDIAIGEIALANHCEPEEAVRELVRVTKPGGFVVLVQLVWKAPVEETRRTVLADHLGARPMMVVEWRRILREAGVVDVQVEDWSDEETAFRSEAVKPFADFAEIFTLAERLSILRRAWQRWGLRGVSTALSRESEVHKLLSSERILGLDLLRGRKVEADPSGLARKDAADLGNADLATEPVAVEGEVRAAASTVEDAPSRYEQDDKPETAGLPLFGDVPAREEE
ncbi:MAG: methyltransferase domain-containing protein [Longimicrobiales bacterium]|nr:methyltransferase domain-containing protein [Longimicrobiales bacterium]